MLSGHLPVVHCPDMEGPPDAVVSRHGDQMKVKCKHSAKSWTLVCQGTAWVGEIGLCDCKYIQAYRSDEPTACDIGCSVCVCVGLFVCARMCRVCIGVRNLF